jgi:hypothetical protein
VSDAALRELERAAREGGDAAAWTRLALAQARAGQDGGRAALQALLRDPAAPVRELLVADRTPAPRALGAPLPPIAHASGPLRAPIDAGLDLGGARVALVAGDELLGVDLLDASPGEAIVWRRPRPEVSLSPAPVRVGPHLVELSGAGALFVTWFDARTGREARRLALPDEVQPLLPEAAECARTGLVALGASRCAVVVEDPDDVWRACFLDLARGELLRVARLASTTPPWPIEASGALVTDADGALFAWEADGAPRWRVEAGQEALLLAGGASSLVARVHDRSWAVAIHDAADGRRLARHAPARLALRRRRARARRGRDGAPGRGAARGRGLDRRGRAPLGARAPLAARPHRRPPRGRRSSATRRRPCASSSRRARRRALAPLALGVEPAPGETDLLDLGGGRALVVTPDTLVGVDLFAGRVG